MDKTIRLTAGLLLTFLLLLPGAVFAQDGVQVSFLDKNGKAASSVQAGDILTLQAVTENAVKGDKLKFSTSSDAFTFSDAKDKKEITVDLVQDGSSWKAQTPIEVKSAGKLQADAQVIRSSGESSSAALEAYDAPKSLIISSNTTNPSVGDSVTLTAKAVGKDGKAVDPSLIRSIEWTVSANGGVLKTNATKGESISFTVPEDFESKTILADAVLTDTSGNEIKAEEYSLKTAGKTTAAIFVSNDSNGIVKGKDIGFSSEIYSDGAKASDDLIKDAAYTWTARLDNEYLNMTKNGTTAVIAPEKTGTLKVSLSVKLKDGTVIGSNEITLNIVEKDTPLTGISVRMKATAGSDDVVTGTTVVFTADPTPAEATNMDAAEWKWTAEQDGKTIASQTSAGDFAFKPEASGTVKVCLTVTPVGEKAIAADPVSFDVTVTSSKDKTLKIISAKIKTDNDLKKVVPDTKLVFNANVESEGSEGEAVYLWQAKDSDGNLLASSSTLKNFAFTPKAEGKITVSFKASVLKDDAEIEEDSLSSSSVSASGTVSSNDSTSVLSQTSSSSASTSASVTKTALIAENAASSSSDSIQTASSSKVLAATAKSSSETAVALSASSASKSASQTEDYAEAQDSVSFTVSAALVSASDNKSSSSSSSSSVVVSTQKSSSESAAGSTTNTSNKGSQQAAASTVKQTNSGQTAGSQTAANQTSTKQTTQTNTASGTRATTVTNPSTGEKLSAGELMGIAGAGALIVVSLLVLIGNSTKRKEHSDYYL